MEAACLRLSLSSDLSPGVFAVLRFISGRCVSCSSICGPSQGVSRTVKNKRQLIG